WRCCRSSSSSGPTRSTTWSTSGWRSSRRRRRRRRRCWQGRGELTGAVSGGNAMRSARLAALLALLGLGASGAKAPAPSAIAVLPGVEISADDPKTRHVESVVAVNPRDPLNLIAASMVFGEASGVAVYSSRDGGRSWKRAANGALSRPLFGGGQDPALAFAPDGNAYLATIGHELALWKSSDGGQSWGEPAVVP